ncbi:hypothetical protein BDP27DRAFT_1424172 [Rhodocollybia butyracea]|uniref:Uncharacterized protein n=1 Tax=Rhodocollybia butyracea TaxID=206335 RepID=A0A9P5PMY8_9AGAR|nr:hypothetical protein BDP27DRAFT_1424172 [Rhodocollybia butyracea]
MTSRVHCLGLIILSVLVFAVHGMPIHVKGGCFVTIINKNSEAVLEGVTEDTRRFIKMMIHEMLGGEENIYYNTVKETRKTIRHKTIQGRPTFSFRETKIHFVVQQSLPETPCNQCPCFGWIYRKGSNSGSIFSLGADGWKRVRDDIPKWNSGDASRFNLDFVKTQGSWVEKWNRVTWWGVKEWKETHFPASNKERPRRKLIPDERCELPILQDAAVAPKNLQLPTGSVSKPPEPPRHPQDNAISKTPELSVNSPNRQVPQFHISESPEHLEHQGMGRYNPYMGSADDEYTQRQTLPKVVMGKQANTE